MQFTALNKTKNLQSSFFSKLLTVFRLLLLHLSPTLHLSLLPGLCSSRSSRFTPLPLSPVTPLRAPALMSHSSSGSSPEIGMGRLAELQSPAHHISYSLGGFYVLGIKSVPPAASHSPPTLTFLHMHFL